MYNNCSIRCVYVINNTTSLHIYVMCWGKHPHIVVLLHDQYFTYIPFVSDPTNNNYLMDNIDDGKLDGRYLCMLLLI